MGWLTAVSGRVVEEARGASDSRERAPGGRRHDDPHARDDQVAAGIQPERPRAGRPAHILTPCRGASRCTG